MEEDKEVSGKGWREAEESLKTEESKERTSCFVALTSVPQSSSGAGTSTWKFLCH